MRGSFGDREGRGKSKALRGQRGVLLVHCVISITSFAQSSSYTVTRATHTNTHGFFWLLLRELLLNHPGSLREQRDALESGGEI